MAQLIARQGNELTIQVKVTLGGPLLEAEATIQDAGNEVGLLATQEALKNFDTDGGPLETGGPQMDRQGGKVWCPAGRTRPHYPG